MRRSTTLVAAAVTSSLLAACGQSGPPRPGTSPTPTPTGYRTDSSGLVACSTQTLPYRFAGAVRFDAALGGVSAQLHAVAVRRSYDQWLSSPQLTLTANGREWQTRLKPAPQAFEQRYRPLAVDGPTGVGGYLCLVRFAGADTPPAVLTTYSGGAHCCTTVRIYDAARRVGQLELGNMNARLTVASGRPLVATRDDTFSYAFTDFADSGAPIRLFEPRGTRFSDVSRQFPALVRADAASMWRLASHRRSKLGFYAAWAADEEMLGRDAYVWRTMHHLERSGDLNVPPNLREPGWPDGPAYVDKLRAFLQRNGY